MPSPPLSKISTLKLVNELEKRRFYLPLPLREISTEDLMSEINTRSTASICVSLRDVSDEKWTMTAVGKHVMGPILKDLLFGASVDDDEPEDPDDS